ncbi:hypothetical protein K2173_002245 [Erythroxylum novogranatense]|uniref:Uncharacterized protein n=1 Tax=Erythroxylum novogranatense TaxID=1862640 RepID=A0AAV8T978_9ROSI|nr:hypothetical protein K2173_002245 [Erythroxylum novogranatense]
MESLVENMSFDMNSLRTNLPQKRGLSRYYSGKSRSFTCMADVHCLEDLKKPERPDAKKRKQCPDRKDLHVPSYPCRRASNQQLCFYLLLQVLPFCELSEIIILDGSLNSYNTSTYVNTYFTSFRLAYSITYHLLHTSIVIQIHVHNIFQSIKHMY